MDQSTNNRAVLLLIAGIPVTMILAATWLWFFVVQGDLDLVGALGTANRGTLVQPPRQLDDVGLFEQNGYEFKYADMEPKWTMLVPASGRAHQVRAPGACNRSSCARWRVPPTDRRPRRQQRRCIPTAGDCCRSGHR